MGIDGADNTIPGIVVIRRDGTIAFRQIAREKDDRLDSGQLLAVVDRTLGTSGAAASSGYAALARMQLGIETNAAFGEDVRSFGALARVAVPLGRFAIAGLRAGYTTHVPFDGSLVAGLRLPFLGDTAALQVTAVGGLANATPYAGGQIGLWFAWSPLWGVHLDGGANTERQAVVTLGISRMISWR